MYRKKILPLLICMLLVSGCAQTGNENIIIESQSEEESSEAATEETTEEPEEAEEATEETSKEDETEEKEEPATKEESVTKAETSDSASVAKTETPAQAAPAQATAASTASVQQAPAQQAPAQAAPAPVQAQAPQEAPTPVATPAPVERKLGSCGKAYEQIAKDYHSRNSNYKYSLAYTNADDIPELVIDKGKWICLYTFENGNARCMQKDWVHNKWTYGTSSICYSPKRNLFFDNNNNYYGDFCYESGGLIYNKYMAENIKIYPAISQVTPSSGAPFPDDATPTIYKDGCANRISDEEGQNIYSTYTSYEWQKLEGTMDYDSLLAKLEELGL